MATGSERDRQRPGRPQRFRLRALSLLLLAALAALFVMLSIEGVVRLEVTASSRHQMWARHWGEGRGDPRLESGRDLLPTQIPGPEDKWAGSQPHGVDIELKAPPGEYRLVLRFFESHASQPPLLALYLDGKQIDRVRVKPGHGRPAPYYAPNRDLTISLPVTLKKAQSTLRIVDLEGSWVAPAALQLEQGWAFNPARAGYLLLSDWLWFGLAALLLLGAVYTWARAGGSRRAAAGSVLLFVFSLSLALAGAELVLREYLIHNPQARRLSAQVHSGNKEQGQQYGFKDLVTPNPDPEIVYNLKPNLNGRFGVNRLVTNSRSMRGPEVELAKRPGVLRVAGVGDSVLFGWGVEYQDTALYQLGLILAKRLGRPVQTLNFGCPSYNTAVEVATYRKKVRAFKPDLAVLIFVANDFGMPSMLLEPVELFTLHHFYLLEQLRRRLGALTREAGDEREFVFMSKRHQAGLDAEGQRRRQSLAERLEPVFRAMTGERAVAGYLRDWASMLHKDGVPGVVVYYPNMVKPLPDNVRHVLAAAGQAGLNVIDMTPIYRKWLAAHGEHRMKDALWVDAEDSHPNHTSNRLIAQAIADLVLERKLLPAAR